MTILASVKAAPVTIPALFSDTVGFVTAEVCELLNAVKCGRHDEFIPPQHNHKRWSQTIQGSCEDSWCQLDLDPFHRNEWHLPMGETNEWNKESETFYSYSETIRAYDKNFEISSSISCLLQESFSSVFPQWPHDHSSFAWTILVPARTLL